jgi:hypothetical protein
MAGTGLQEAERGMRPELAALGMAAALMGTSHSRR